MHTATLVFSYLGAIFVA